MNSGAADTRKNTRAWRRVAGWVLLLAGVLLNSAAGAVDTTQLPPAADRPVDFVRDIQPILENACIRCHGAERPKSRFSLVSREAALKGGAQGVAIIPGDSAGSPLIHYVAGLDEDMLMPPAGKGERLTAAEIGLLRTWIDQGAPWGEVQTTDPRPRFSFTPSMRWIAVKGDSRKFREHYWMKEGFNPGVEEFSMREQLDEESTVTVQGRAFPIDEDYDVSIRYDRREVGYVRGGFRQFRRYYDNSGGFYPFAPPVFELPRDLHVDNARAWVEAGTMFPDWPRVSVGYDYEFRQGVRATMQWGEVRTSSAPLLPATGIARNIYPAFKDVDEQVHTIRLHASHEVAGVFIEDLFRAEFYDMKTRRMNAVSLTAGQPQPTRSVVVEEGHNQFRAANILRMEKELREWWFVSGGYLYSMTDADASFNQTPIHATGVPVSGDYWKSHAIVLSQNAHVFNANLRLGPWEGFTLSSGVQSEWAHQKGVGRVSFDTGNPALFLLIQPATLDANLDRLSLQENVALRFTRIPYTSLFAEARLEQERIGQYEDQVGGGHDFVRDTDASSDTVDVRGGFYTAPFGGVSFGGHYRKRDKRSAYDDRIDLEGDGPGDSYPAFIRSRRIDTDEVELRATARPARWLKTTLSWQVVATDFHTETDALAGISPGGSLRAGNFDAMVYGLNVVLTPWKRWYFSGTFNYYDSRLQAAANNVPSVVPYRGDIYSAFLSASWMWNEKTDLLASYNFSLADYAQDHFATGLPMGIRYERHGAQVGVRRQLREWASGQLMYGFFDYSEPSSAGFNDYQAHAVFATLSVRWK